MPNPKVGQSVCRGTGGASIAPMPTGTVANLE